MSDSFGAMMGRIQRSSLKPRPRLVLMALVGAMDGTDGTTSIPRLCDRTGGSEDFVRRGLAELCDLGVVTIEGREGTARAYRADLDAMPSRPVANTDRSGSATGRKTRPVPVANNDRYPPEFAAEPPGICDPSASNRIGRAGARSFPSSCLSSTSPLTPQGEGEGDEGQGEGYYSPKGGNPPARTEPPPSPPEAPTEVEMSPVPGITAARFRAAVQTIEQRLIDCIPVAPRRGKPYTLGSEALRVISALLVEHGPRLLEERIGRCAGMELPLRALMADLAKDPPTLPAVRAVTQPPPDPRPEQSESDRLRGLVLLTRTVIEDLERKREERGGLSSIDAKRLEKLRGDLPGYQEKLAAAEAAEVLSA